MQNWIKGGILFVAGGIAQRILDRVLDYFEIALLPETSSEMLLIIGLVVGGSLIVYGIYRSRQLPTNTPSFDPKLRHINARLFYPPKRRWHKTRVLKKYWWETWKQSPSRYKLVLVKDLKKAYYVGTYAWNLITKGEIEWFSEDDQDLEEWCRKEGYTLIKEEATEDNLLEPYFNAEIVNKREEYRQGESILFRTHYRGNLVNGFFDNEIRAPKGKVFPGGQLRRWSWSPDTLINDHPSTPGNLNGYITHYSEWSWIIPDDAPMGEYDIFMRVYNHFGIGNRSVIKEKRETITILSGKTTHIEKKQLLKKKASFEETKTELLRALYFFPEHWKMYKQLIKKKELKLPQNGEIKWCSDQIKSAIVRARMLNLNKINVVLPQIEAVSHDMAMLGVDVLQFSRSRFLLYTEEEKTIRNLIQRGDVAYEKVKELISVVEQAFR